MDESANAMKFLASYASEFQKQILDDYLDEFGLTRETLPTTDRVTALKFFYRLHGFNRKGAPDEYRFIAISALEAVDSDEELPSDELWEHFKQGCERENIGVNESHTEGVIKDVAELANREGNLFDWVRREVEETGRLTTPYLDLKSANGIGRKIARFFLRDAVWASDLESDVVKKDREYLQPIDIWVRRSATTIWPELDRDGIGDDHISQHIAEACQTHRISNIEFNQGAWYFGSKVMDGDEKQVKNILGNEEFMEVVKEEGDI